MKRDIPLAAAIVLALSSIWCAGQNSGTVKVEADRTKPPAEASPLVTVAAKGVQIYRCDQTVNGPAWVFIAPEATLFMGEEPRGEAVGTHGAGPVWQWSDGTAVKGAVIAKQSAAEPDAIPWLLLRATPTPESAAAGRLQGVAFVRRFDTRGGVEPATGCDAAHHNGEARVPYTAKYTFYR